MITINVRKSTRCNGDNSLYVSFPYDSNIVNIIRCQPTRYWNATTKEWELPYMSLDKLQAALKNYDVKVNNNLQAVEKTNNTLPVNFKFKTKPYEHQKYSLQYGINHDKWLLCDEQGLGKTKQVIDIAVAKKQLYGYKHCLIVCGVNGLKWNWLKEIELHSDETGYILGQRKKRNQIVIGSATDKLCDVENIESIQDYFIITNVETLRNAEITAKLSKLCADNIINMVAIDEIHKCFDYDTLISTDLGELKIGDIVTNKIKCNVISYNELTNNFETKPITNYFENAIFDEMLELDIETSNGVKTIKCTKNHLFYTSNRGWVKADELTSNDDIVEY